jgi:hypothetical protein
LTRSLRGSYEDAVRLQVITELWSSVTVWCGVLAVLQAPAAESGPNDPNPSLAPALILHESLVAGANVNSLNIDDVEQVFSHVFARLPSEATIYPSENYYYFQLLAGGRQLWGNLRLPAGMRERGIVSFAYAEFAEFPFVTTNRFTRSKFFDQASGVGVKALDPFNWQLTHRGRTVTFHLHPLIQEAPKRFALARDEAFVMRTYDESGYQFFLLFNTARNFFFWVLNEEENVPDNFEPLGPDVLIGRRTGFAFWIDRSQGGRKVLASVRKASALRNDYFDGPFDQLADNYVEGTKVSEYMQRAYPVLKGRIDKLGYYTDRKNQRVGLACYATYEQPADVLTFLAKEKSALDTRELIGRAADRPSGGR